MQLLQPCVMMAALHGPLLPPCFEYHHLLLHGAPVSSTCAPHLPVYAIRAEYVSIYCS